MQLKLKIFMICLCLVFILFVYRKNKKGNLQLKYGLPWYTISIILIFVTIFDKILHPLKVLFGFETISNMVLVFGFLVLIMLVFSLYMNFSELSAKNTKLTQEVALLKKELENYGNDKKTNKKI